MEEWRKKIKIAGREAYPDWKYHEMIEKMLKERYDYGDLGDYGSGDLGKYHWNS